MVSGINSISTSSVSLLFGTGHITATGPTSSAVKLLRDATGYTDDVMRTGNAIGTIIALASEQDKKSTLFQMKNAVREYGANGEYTETATGQGAFSSDEEMALKTVMHEQEEAKGSGPNAARAQAYLKALDDGTLQSYDMSDMGVTSTLTKTIMYYADGRVGGERVTFDTKGKDKFIADHITIDTDGMMRDTKTGKYASIQQNGTEFTYLVY
ncbi:hypothetical protein [Neorhizobium galegae]|uniref:Uncharacterized protein n=1 Tax=Neorhizobium galegae bv. orientalis str. HAMBI 540 TaxID=1028800 RepID=A0A068SKY2_NEOGA|nr:hypothetical protein [Neorhizobium galegae]CDN46424.1 Hypothetical protein RG540_CH02290 [Neorhizobium galegae bv. orientalis str. HAMBI 540]